MKDPAFLFYSSDFLNGISDLTMEERGQYITLLCLQHQKDELTEKTIRLSVGSVSVDVISKFIRLDNGNLVNERLRNEIEKRKIFTESRRNNGIKGGRPKKPLGKPTDNLMEDENENENINSFKEGVLYFSNRYSTEMLNNFINYWLSPLSNGKTRFEKEKTFDIEKRLRTWYGKESKKLDYSIFSEYEKQLIEKWVNYLAKNGKYLIQDSVNELKKVIDTNGGVPGFRLLIEKAIASGWKSLVIEKKPEFVPKF